MNNERIEPQIAHEYIVRISRSVDPDTGAPLLTFDVRTVREFTAFGYRIELHDVSSTRAGIYGFEIGGISIPSVAPAATGSATGTLAVSMPTDGTYRLQVSRKQRTASFDFVVTNGIPVPLGPQDGGFIVAEYIGS